MPGMAGRAPKSSQDLGENVQHQEEKRHFATFFGPDAIGYDLQHTTFTVKPPLQLLLPDGQNDRSAERLRLASSLSKMRFHPYDPDLVRLSGGHGNGQQGPTQQRERLTRGVNSCMC